jgi:hypothetical protein
MVIEVANLDFLEIKIIQAKWLLRGGSVGSMICRKEDSDNTAIPLIGDWRALSGRQTI